MSHKSECFPYFACSVRDKCEFCILYAIFTPAFLTRMSCIIGYESRFWDDHLTSVILITVLMPQCTLIKPTN